MGTNSNDETQDSSVVVSIDGEYVNRPRALNASLFDLERVEVLRGPQGTLFGRNATAGVVQFVTRKPGDEFALNASASYGNYEQLVVEGGVTVPLGDFASVRVAAIHSDNEGYNFHPNINARSGDRTNTSVRGTLMLTPTEQFEIMFQAEFTDTESVGNYQAFVNYNTPGNRADETGPDFTDACSSPGWVEVGPVTPGVQCIPSGVDNLSSIDRFSYDSPLFADGSSDVESLIFRGQVTYDFDFATFTYQGAYRDTDIVEFVPLSPAYTFNGFQIDTETQSHEFRLNGEFENGIVWQGGAFLFMEDQEIERGLFLPFIGPNGGYVTYFARPFVNTDSWSIFGQAEFPLTDQLTLVAGGRYTDDQREAQFDNYGFTPNSGPIRLSQNGFTPGSSLMLDVQNDKFTWLAGLNFEPTDNTLIYAKASTGFKAGGFDSVGTYAPETNRAYELGTKNTFGAITLNAAAFYYDYTDLQVAVLLDPSVGGQIFNAAEATIWGLEGELDAQVTDNDRLSLTINYLNAEFDSFPASVAVQDLGGGLNGINEPFDLSGNEPPRSPDVIISAGWQHVFPIRNGDELIFDVFSRFNSGYSTSVFNWVNDEQDSFTKTDVSLTYVPENGHWSIQMFARNLENKRELTYAAFTSAGPDDIYNFQFGTPRTWGGRINVEF